MLFVGVVVSPLATGLRLLLLLFAVGLLFAVIHSQAVLLLLVLLLLSGGDAAVKACKTAAITHANKHARVLSERERATGLGSELCRKRQTGMVCAGVVGRAIGRGEVEKRAVVNALLLRCDLKEVERSQSFSVWWW